MHRGTYIIVFFCIAFIPVYADERDDRLKSLGVSRWHDAGHLGQKVTVAVLDTGFRGYRQQLGKTLPHTVQIKSFRHDGNLEAKDSVHGLLCAEIIHTIAPQARLLFANWEPDQPKTFLAALRWAKEQGASVVSCSTVIPSWGDGRGGGAVNHALTSLLGETDLVLVAATGNMAQRHWSGPFRGNGAFHEWDDRRTETTLTPWPNTTLAIDLVATKGTYRLRLFTDDGEETALRIHTTPNGGTSARLLPRAKSYRLRVQHWDGPREAFRLTVMGAELRDHVATGSLVFPAENPRVLAVGAVDERQQRCSYSGMGDTTRTLDLVALTSFPCRMRREPFEGTSATAPQAAGIAALVRSRYPAWSAEKVHTFLHTHSTDVGPRGHDVETGHGLLRLPKP